MYFLSQSRKYAILGFATGLGTGYFPVASGTFSTLIIGIPVYLLFSMLNTWWYSLGMIGFIGASVYLCGEGDRILNESDSSKVVMDEFCGYLVTMWLIPGSVITVIAGFFLFRFFDIIKVQPAKWIDRNMKNGLGVVLDDIVAGIYANLCLRLGILVFPYIFYDS